MTIEDVVRDLTGDHPWIPGAHFRNITGLQEYLIDAVKAFPSRDTTRPLNLNLATAVSELIAGDKIWAEGGVQRKISSIDRIGPDTYDLYFDNGDSSTDLAGDLTYNLVELHEGIDF